VQPGWRWSEHVKPVAGTELREAPHQHYQISGRIRVKMSDGTEIESGADDLGHNYAGAAKLFCGRLDR
jgi:hypothetical protein